MLIQYFAPSRPFATSLTRFLVLTLSLLRAPSKASMQSRGMAGGPQGVPSSFVLPPHLLFFFPFRSSFLFHLLNDCFGDAMWLPSMAGMAGEVGLLVMDTFPLMPYFWAIVLSKVCVSRIGPFRVTPRVPRLLKEGEGFPSVDCDSGTVSKPR